MANPVSYGMRGFTLVELLVVMTIIASLATLMLVNYRTGSQNFAEQRSLQNIAQAIRSAQIKALGSELACIPLPPIPIFYGAHFDTTSSEIMIFASCDDDQYDAGEEFIGETKELEQGVSITSFSFSYSCGVSSICLDILFEAPDPTVSFNPSGGTSATITITGGRSVTVGLGGSVDIN